jgi:hypothetical protein
MKNSEISDAVFERIAVDTFKSFDLDKAFYTKVAGVAYPNKDGSKRARIIADCDVGTALELRPEPENKYDPNAVAIVRLGLGEQLGYLESGLASEVARDFREFGPCWLALFRHPNHHPETGAIVGAVIYMMRLPAEELAEEG